MLERPEIKKIIKYKSISENNHKNYFLNSEADRIMYNFYVIVFELYKNTEMNDSVVSTKRSSKHLSLTFLYARANASGYQ